MSLNLPHGLDDHCSYDARQLLRILADAGALPPEIWELLEVRAKSPGAHILTVREVHDMICSATIAMHLHKPLSTLLPLPRLV